MKQYNDLFRSLIKRIDTEGFSENRTDTDTISTFGHLMRFNMGEGFPLPTCRQLSFRLADIEMRWITMGGNNTKYLNDNNVLFWNQWANEDGDLGPVYGYQLRHWESNGIKIDQLSEITTLLKLDPKSRRLLCDYWNPSVVPNTGKSFEENIAEGKQALPPCHVLFNFGTRKLTERDLPRLADRWARIYRTLTLEKSLIEKKVIAAFNEKDTAKIEALYERGSRVSERLKFYTHHDENANIDQVRKPTMDDLPEYGLSLLLYMRSNDTAIGMPTNVAGYSYLLELMAKECGMMSEDYVHVTGDTHLYQNQITQIKQQIAREPRLLPIIDIEFGYDHDPKNTDPRSYFFENFDKVKAHIYGYDPHPAIQFEKAAK